MLLIANLICFVMAYGKITSNFWRYGVLNEEPAAFHSGIPLFNYDHLTGQLSELAQNCRLDLQNMTGIVADDSSYPFVQRSNRVLHTMGINWLGADIIDQEKLLRRARIGAVLARCSSLRPEVTQGSEQLGDLCFRVFN